MPETGQPVTICAHGTQDQNVYPRMQILLNGVVAGEWDVQAGSEAYTALAGPAGGSMHFQEQDAVGSERARFTAGGMNEGSYNTLPFGDGFTNTCSDDDASHYSELDHDIRSDTYHAQYRQYSSTSGRWMSPDPYSGSYDLTNPQSMSRYACVLNLNGKR